MSGVKNRKGKIVWLASYPKSGNTWYRIFLSHLFHDAGKEQFSLNQLRGGGIASSRSLFEEAVGISASELTQDEVDNLRPEVYQYFSDQYEEPQFHKIHDAYTHTVAGKPLVPEAASLCALYFIRNPLDVAISFAHHLSLDIDKTIKLMGDNQYAFCSKPEGIQLQFRQKLLSWSGHVQSWTKQKEIPLLVVRYEDMLEETLKTFEKTINFVGLKFEKERIKEAVEASSFEKIKKMELEEGFREKPMNTGAFFREGKSGSWKQKLNKKQIETIISQHGEVMEQFGYL